MPNLEIIDIINMKLDTEYKHIEHFLKDWIDKKYNNMDVYEILVYLNHFNISPKD